MKIKGISYLLIVLLLLSSQFLFAQKQNDSLYFIAEDEITKVTDGDTFRFKNLTKPTRLLFIDTEETFKGKDSDDKLQQITDKWLEHYYEQKQEKKSEYPIKLESPFGMQTTEWAKEFFKDVTRVRIEKDDTLRGEDMFGRYLVYLMAEKNGKYVNYALECVRQGYSPYFNKYGNSSRFHKEFAEAQEYAKTNRLGIWNPSSKCYPDYEERIKWWNERAEELEYFYANYANDLSVINLLNGDAQKRLKDAAGKEVTVFGNIGEVNIDRFPYLLRNSITKEVSLDILIDEKDLDVYNTIDVKRMESNYFYCAGRIEERDGRFKMYVTNKEQIRFK